MTCKTVTTQAEMDAARAEVGVTCIHIESGRGVWLRVGPSSATVRAYGSATVEACDSARVEACDSARVEACDSATVEACDSATVRASGSATVRASSSATVEAYGSARVEAYGSARVEAYGSATVRACDSATVEACDSATVEACDSATVRAYGSARVEACDSARVEACDSATVEAYGSASVHARHEARVTAGPQVAVYLHSSQATVTGGVVINLTTLDLDDAQVWCEHHGVEIVDGRAQLYKAVDDGLAAGHRYTHTVYPLGAEVTAADWRDDHACGGGLHLSPTPRLARCYFSRATRYLRCSVALADLRPINVGDIAKCKVRALTVEAEVDLLARPVPAPAA